MPLHSAPCRNCVNKKASLLKEFGSCHNMHCREWTEWQVKHDYYKAQHDQERRVENELHYVKELSQKIEPNMRDIKRGFRKWTSK